MSAAGFHNCVVQSFHVLMQIAAAAPAAAAVGLQA
jgi:hypothetical protein